MRQDRAAWLTAAAKSIQLSAVTSKSHSKHSAIISSGPTAGQVSEAITLESAGTGLNLSKASDHARAPMLTGPMIAASILPSRRQPGETKVTGKESVSIARKPPSPNDDTSSEDDEIAWRKLQVVPVASELARPLRHAGSGSSIPVPALSAHSVLNTAIRETHFETHGWMVGSLEAVDTKLLDHPGTFNQGEHVKAQFRPVQNGPSLAIGPFIPDENGSAIPIGSDTTLLMMKRELAENADSVLSSALRLRVLWGGERLAVAMPQAGGSSHARSSDASWTFNKLASRTPLKVSERSDNAAESGICVIM
jgi:hypothetical protein